jgi:hypothetical protein
MSSRDTARDIPITRFKELSTAASDGLHDVSPPDNPAAHFRGAPIERRLGNDRESGDRRRTFIQQLRLRFG